MIWKYKIDLIEETMSEFEEILNSHPEMIPVSKSPAIWNGLLSLSHNCNKNQLKIRIKLIVPNYPDLNDAKVYFGKKIALLHGTNFKEQFITLLNNASSVHSFLNELQLLLSSLMKNKIRDCSINTAYSMDSMSELLKELNTVLSEPSDVELSSSKDLSLVKLTMDDVSIVIQRFGIGEESWKVITSDLPKLPERESLEDKLFSLRKIRDTFKRQIYYLENFWRELRLIDRDCWVVDPINPKTYHKYRRIKLSPLLSVMVILNPLNPKDFPEIKFLGSVTEVEKYEDLVLGDIEAFEKWDCESSVVTNLLNLLDIDEFPRPPIAEIIEQEEGIFGEEDCCICFSLNLDDGPLPDKICGNERCKRHFHSACLWQWLQELTTNNIVFNYIHGPCPNCGENISCSINPQ